MAFFSSLPRPKDSNTDHLHLTQAAVYPALFFSAELLLYMFFIIFML